MNFDACRLINDKAESALKLFTGVQLIFADPPFNIGKKYTGYRDRLKRSEFEQMIFDSASAAFDALLPDGVLCLHGPLDLCRVYDRWSDSRDDVERFNYITWTYTFGNCQRVKFIDAQCHCYMFRKRGQKHKWRPENVLMPSARVKYKDKRISQSPNGGKRLPGNVWGIPDDGTFWGRVQGTNAERVKERPNQLPELYMERLVLAFTDPGDVVCDPFCGSGTMVVVANALGRKAVGIDLDAGAIEATRKRLEKGAVRVPSGRYL